MKYSIESIKIKSLIKIIENGHLDLSPSYQREFIWSLKDQKELIKTIEKKYPLPNIFINTLSNGNFEMVDGQQRSRSIFRFYKDEIKITKKDDLHNLEKEEFLNYELPVVFISDATKEEIREFYVLINKQGKFLNNPEVQRSAFGDTNFLKLAEDITNSQALINLDLFSTNSSIRLNDRDFIQELLGYLLMYKRDLISKKNSGYEGIRDKKKYIESEIFEKDISEEEVIDLRKLFNTVLDKITKLNEIHPINRTRYRQRNDFYSLFNYINKHDYLSIELLIYQYKILLVLDGKDSKGNQFISPNNDYCETLKAYAINCVSQSNSKKARMERLDFFEKILTNKEEDTDFIDDDLADVLSYLADIKGDENILTHFLDYYLIDITQFNS